MSHDATYRQWSITPDSDESGGEIVDETGHQVATFGTLNKAITELVKAHNDDARTQIQAIAQTRPDSTAEAEALQHIEAAIRNLKAAYRAFTNKVACPDHISNDVNDAKRKLQYARLDLARIVAERPA